MATRIGILTGGGDVPGLNSVIKEVVYRGTENQCEVLGIRKGWEGLTHLNYSDEVSREKYLWPLDRANTRTIDRYGGTVLHSSRVSPSRMKSLPDFLTASSFSENNRTWDVSSHVLRNIEHLRLDYVIVIGGGRHVELCVSTGEAGRQGNRDSQNHGQRRAGNGVFGGLLDRHHSGHSSDSAPADHGRLARARGDFPCLWPRFGFHFVVYRLRHVTALRHS